MRKALLALVLCLGPSWAWAQPQQVLCNRTAVGSSGAATTQVVAPSGTQVVNVCGFDVTTGAAAATFQMTYGTGATCGTGTVNITGAYQFGINSGIASTGRQYSTPQGQGLCVVVTGTGPVQWTVYYSQF